MPGKTYPMVVYMYEKLSRNLHNYSVPSDRSPYNPAVFTARGLLLLEPRHHASAPETRASRRSTRSSRRSSGCSPGPRRPQTGGRDGPLLGRLRDRLPRHAVRPLRRRRRRGPADRPAQHVRLGLLEQRPARDRPLRDRPGADAGPLLGRPRRLPPELARSCRSRG